jgi:hypothetical protein
MSRFVKFIEKCFYRLLYPARPFWTSNIYGFGKWIRVYGFYPPILPLCVYTDHGPGEDDLAPYDHELNSSSPVQLYHSIGNVRKWRRISKKPCFVIHSPFVFARKKLKINYDCNSKGSIFFVAHSTPDNNDNKTPEHYHRELLELPDRFLPITICLHIHDVVKGLDNQYRKYGYDVLTAGDSLDPNFTENFYKIVSKHKYALSNTFGSYGLYTTEMGMPFGLYGSEPDYENVSDPNIPSGKYSIYKDYSYFKKAQILFGQLPSDSVSDEKIKFSRYYLGLDYGVGRFEMAYILYKSLFIWIFYKINLFKN